MLTVAARISAAHVEQNACSFALIPMCTKSTQQITPHRITSHFFLFSGVSFIQVSTFLKIKITYIKTTYNSYIYMYIYIYFGAQPRKVRCGNNTRVVNKKQHRDRARRYKYSSHTALQCFFLLFFFSPFPPSFCTRHIKDFFFFVVASSF